MPTVDKREIGMKFQSERGSSADPTLFITKSGKMKQLAQQKCNIHHVFLRMYRIRLYMNECCARNASFKFEKRKQPPTRRCPRRIRCILMSYFI